MRAIVAFVLMSAAMPAFANDSMAELRTGGLTYVRSDAVRMASEDLYVSLDQVVVDYVFENTTDEDVESIVAFPMPDLTGSPYEASPVPDDSGDNFLSFSVSVEGEPFQPQLVQRAEAFGLGITDELVAQGVPLLPNAQNTYEALAALDPALLDDWTVRGIIVNDVYDDGTGMKGHPSPIWTLKSEFWWRMVFPAGQKISVSHSYVPSVGGTAGLSFISYDGMPSEQHALYVEKYCMDESFDRAVAKRIAAAGDGMSPLFEQRISYILTTASNWSGAIGRFHLTIDKGSTANLVSFCGSGVKKTAPTRFELTYEDYYPQRDLDVLILTGVN